MASDPVSVQVRRLVDEALATFDAPAVSTSALVRKAQRIAVLRRDYGMQIGLVYQTLDLTVKNETPLPALVSAREQLETLLGSTEGVLEAERQYQSFLATRTHDNKGHFVGVSVAQLEDGLAALERAYDDAEPTPGMTPLDTGLESIRAREARGSLFPNLQRHRTALGKVRQWIHDYLVLVETDILAGKADSDVFRRAQLYINESLKRFAPEALDKFVAAQDSLSAGSNEDYAHAVTSCRRLIKALADAVYPATDEAVEGIDGVTREMTDDRYKNRLTEYVRTKVEGKRQRQTVVAILGDLHSRLTGLDGLASKGVHDHVTQAEAETCVVWTYLLAGDIVRIADGSSALLVETTE